MANVVKILNTGEDVSEQLVSDIPSSLSYANLATTNGKLFLGSKDDQPIEIQNAKPDGSTSLIDRTGKIDAKYFNDSIVGQLIYGGVVFDDGDMIYVVLTNRLAIKLGKDTNVPYLVTNGDSGDINYSNCEGAYFIASSYNGFSFAGFDFQVGDWLISTGSAWKKIDNTDAVTGVKGSNEQAYRTGNINITKENIGITDNNLLTAGQKNLFGQILTYAGKTVYLTGEITWNDPSTTKDIFAVMVLHYLTYDKGVLDISYNLNVNRVKNDGTQSEWHLSFRKIKSIFQQQKGITLDVPDELEHYETGNGYYEIRSGMWTVDHGDFTLGEGDNNNNISARVCTIGFRKENGNITAYTYLNPSHFNYNQSWSGQVACQKFSAGSCIQITGVPVKITQGGGQ